MKTVLFIHGFSAKKEDNEYLIQYLKHYRNIKVHTFTLPGHENDKVTFIPYQKWLIKAEEEFLHVKTRNTIIIGHSMGAIIAAHLASKYKVEKLILLSPAYIFGSIKQNQEDIKNMFKNRKENVETGFEGVMTKMRDVPIKSVMEYYKLSHKGRTDLTKITCPVLVMHGDKDNVISVKSSEYVLNHLKSKKEFVKITGVRHQIFKSQKKEAISEYIYYYICGGLIYLINKRKEI